MSRLWSRPLHREIRATRRLFAGGEDGANENARDNQQVHRDLPSQFTPEDLALHMGSALLDVLTRSL